MDGLKEKIEWSEKSMKWMQIKNNMRKTLQININIF